MQSSASSLTHMRFSIEHWDHLYSLHRAIQHNQQWTGRRLQIKGQIRNQTLLEHQDTPIQISFLQSDQPPQYPELSIDNTVYPVLADICREDEHISVEIPVDRMVFEELRRNLMEYADIDGIHIMVSICVAHPSTSWAIGQTLPLLELDYAMRGDA